MVDRLIVGRALGCAGGETAVQAEMRESDDAGENHGPDGEGETRIEILIWARQGKASEPKHGNRHRGGLTGRPSKLALTEQMDVQVRDAFATVGAVIDDETEAVFEVEFAGDGFRRE